MKFAKLSIVALSLGLFIASCGNSESTEGAATDTTVVAPEATAPVEAAPVTTDTVVAPVADTTAAAPAPAAH